MNIIAFHFFLRCNFTLLCGNTSLFQDCQCKEKQKKKTLKTDMSSPSQSKQVGWRGICGKFSILDYFIIPKTNIETNRQTNKKHHRPDSCVVGRDCRCDQQLLSRTEAGRHKKKIQLQQTVGVMRPTESEIRDFILHLANGALLRFIMPWNHVHIAPRPISAIHQPIVLSPTRNIPPR